MTKNLALAASMAVMLMAISDQAFANPIAADAQHWPQTTANTDPQMAAMAFDQVTATQTADLNAYRYHGGPKAND